MSKKEKNSKLDSLVYWVAQIALAAAATFGIATVLQPVDVVFVYPITFLLVAACMYISHSNR